MSQEIINNTELLKQIEMGFQTIFNVVDDKQFKKIIKTLVKWDIPCMNQVKVPQHSLNWVTNFTILDESKTNYYFSFNRISGIFAARAERLDLRGLFQLAGIPGDIGYSTKEDDLKPFYKDHVFTYKKVMTCLVKILAKSVVLYVCDMQKKQEEIFTEKQIFENIMLPMAQITQCFCDSIEKTRSKNKK